MARQTPAEREAAIRRIKDKVCADFADDNIRPEEVVLKSNGDLVIDRRSSKPWAKPITIGRWS